MKFQFGLGMNKLIIRVIAVVILLTSFSLGAKVIFLDVLFYFCSYNVWFMIMTYFLPMISMCYTYSR